MKRFILISALSLFSCITFSQTNNPKFKFEKKTIKLEKAKAGDVLEMDYVFENIGNMPLIINDIKVACSCTKPIWPLNPILSGESDTIHVTVQTKTMIGWQDRTLEIQYNSSETPEKIRFKIMVDNPEAKKK